MSATGPNSKALRVVVADDHRLFVEGIKTLFHNEPGISIVADTDNGDALLALIETLKPDVAIVDISMPGPGMAAIVDKVAAMDVRCGLLALTMHLEPAFASGLIKRGLAGYVIKDALFEELLDAVRTVAAGGQYVSARVAELQGDMIALTPRELQCLKGVAEGLTNKMIARQIDVGERTVRFHLNNLCRKLGVQRRSQAVAVARRQGLLLG